MLGRAPSVSDSLYSPILINPVPPDPLAVTKKQPAPRLKYPYPLPILALADFVYTIHHRYTAFHRPSTHLLALCIIRCVVLLIVLGGSRRWRSRGGWVGAVSVVSIGSVVWEGCRGQLLGKGQAGSGEGIDIAFLVITGLIAVIEYLSFLALLRLSPPSYRMQPFSLRTPPSAIQSATQFAYSESPASALTRHQSRRGIGHGHGRYDSITSRLRAHDEHQQPEQALVGDEEEMGFDDSGSISESEISESSIIDLPPPLEPHRLNLAPSVSLAALDLESSPVIGPLIRRTRSARFSTVRNLGKAVATEPAEPVEGEGEQVSTSYGTFGMA